MYPVVTATAAPVGSLVLNQPLPGLREFELTIIHGPFQRESIGDPVAREMLIWGNIDLGCNEKIQDTEANSRWLPYISRRQLVLSAGPGNKTINVKLRNDTGTSAVLLGPKDKPVPPLVVGNDPHTSLLWMAYKRGTTLTGWSPSHACTQYHFALHKVERATYPDRVDVTSGGALAAGQYIEVPVAPLPANKSEYRILIPQIYIAPNWYPDSVTS